jgi:hypothetical protein
MPETSVNEHRELARYEREVWPTWQRSMATPSRNSIAPKQNPQRQFCRGITSALHSGHNARPLSGGKDIRHTTWRRLS